MRSKALNSDSSQISKERIYVALLAAIQFAHIVDFVVLMPLGPTLMEYFTISPKQFATLVSSYSFSAAIAGICYGVIADRFGRKNLLIFCFLGFIIGTLLCGLTNDFHILLSARIVAGCFGGVLNGIVFAIVTDLIPFERRGNAMGIVMSAFSIASILGVPIGLAISDEFGWQKTFWFIAFFSLPILLASIWIFPHLKDHLREASVKEELLRFFKLLKNMDYFKAYILILIIGTSSFMLIPFLSPYGVKNVGIDAKDLKYVYLIGGLFTVITSRMIGRMTDRFGTLRVFIILALVSFLPIYLYTNAAPMSLFTYLAMSAFFMVIVSGRFIPAMTMVSAVANKDERGTFMGLLNSIRAWASALATLIAGAIIVEQDNGKLENFDLVGYLSMAVTLAAIAFSFVIYKIVQSKQIQEIRNEENN